MANNNNMKLLALFGTAAGFLSIISYLKNLPEVKISEFLNNVINENTDPTTALHLCIKSEVCSLKPHYESIFFRSEIESLNLASKEIISSLIELGADPYAKIDGTSAIELAEKTNACAYLSLKRSTCEEQQIGSCSEGFINNNINFHHCDVKLANELHFLFNNTFNSAPAPAPEYHI